MKIEGTTIDLPKQFGRYPAGRYETDGPFSGEKFRESLLIPYLKKNEKIKIVLDGARGYGSSFLEEAFGGLVRKGYQPNELIQRITLISKDESLVFEIEDYIKKAEATA